MNRQVVSAIALAVAALSAGQALAQDATPKTREQVRAEVMEAIRTGDVVADADTGVKLNQLFPGRYAAQTAVAQGKTRAEVKAEVAQAIRNGELAVNVDTGEKINTPATRQPATAVAQGKTRAEVKAELAEAIRNGDVIADADTGVKLNQMFPDRYPSHATLAQGKTRADVKAELAEAVRNGDIVAGDNGKTLRELNPGRYPAASMN